MPKDRRDEALDRFWTIDELLPKRQGAQKIPPQPYSTDTVELTIDPPSGESKPSASPLTRTQGTASASTQQSAPLVYHTIPPRESLEVRKKPEPVDRYKPENSLLHAVRIYRWPTEYDYYARFMQDARRYLRTDAPPLSARALFLLCSAVHPADRKQTELVSFLAFTGPRRHLSRM